MEISKPLQYYSERLQPEKATKIVATLKKPYSKGKLRGEGPLESLTRYPWKQVRRCIHILDYETIRNYVIRYKSGGLKALLNDNHKGYSSELSKSETGQLDNHLDGNTTKEFKKSHSVS
ncbi:MAG: hypothetical protein MRK01_14860 [Candidatus Scalindua sp.]|nr:hypothetical protein [Candidatus Scalindua sp.]